jgi:hypothetical protein
MHGFFIDWAQGIVVCVNKSLQLRDEIVSRASLGQFHPCSFAWSRHGDSGRFDIIMRLCLVSRKGDLPDQQKITWTEDNLEDNLEDDPARR